MDYTIINKNLEKLNNAIKTFPDILGKYQKSKDANERASLKDYAFKADLRPYIDFIDWINRISDLGQSVVYNHQISFNELKEVLVQNAIDVEVKDFLKKKNRRGMISFLNSELFSDYNGGYRGRRGRRKSYSINFLSSTCIISNYLIQNPDIKLEINRVHSYYITEIPNFEAEVNTELEITNDICKSIVRKIKTIKYDFRKLNFDLLKTQIEKTIKDRMLSVDKGEQIKCIEESQIGITFNKIYSVNSYSMNSGKLMVNITNDSGVNRDYNYRIFESVAKSRESSIDEILSLLEE